ncbi:glutamate-cysteine ligase family protein [Actinoplanes sp. NPDC051851]|uniref:glutamate-cysteine ligase family protein n=1 Tax=Actinoplanes sp. NPDC051851 TaxID=3154753 RepID=UPI0034444B3E
MRALRGTEEAVAHIAGICFKTGPPRTIGAELEWTLHCAGDPAAPVPPGDLRAALGPHAPASLGNPEPEPLPAGGAVTVEPGGQVEISSAPAGSLTALYDAVCADRESLTELLARRGLVLGEHGIDPYRSPRRILDTPRYAAMERAFDRPGRTMMGSTAGLQVCLDAGEGASVPLRWAALHEIGPALVALFANSRTHAGRDTRWASARMAAWLGIDPRRAGPAHPGTSADPATAWAHYALASPLLCVRRDHDRWDAPPGVTFADWITAGGLEERRAGPGRVALRRVGTRRGGTPRTSDHVARPPTLADLDYHLGTLFPPVRPRGYLEVRYLDTQPGAEWVAPVAVVAALLADDATTERARELVRPAAGRWRAAARLGLADPVIRVAAARVAELACARLDRTGLPEPVRAEVAGAVSRRLDAAVAGNARRRAYATGSRTGRLAKGNAT